MFFKFIPSKGCFDVQPEINCECSRDSIMHEICEVPIDILDKKIKSIMMQLRWKEDDDSKDLFYTGGSDAIIHVFNANNQKEVRILSGWNP